MKLTVFRTEGKGWGVKAAEKIKKSTYVTDYVGEIITNEQAEERGKVYGKQDIAELEDLKHDILGATELIFALFHNCCTS